MLRGAFLNIFREGGCPDHVDSTYGSEVSGRFRADDTTLTIDASILSQLKGDDRVEQVYNAYNCK